MTKNFVCHVRGVKGQKNGPKWQKILCVALNISGTIHHMIVIYGTHLWTDNISKAFFHFFKILIFWAMGGKRAENGPKWQKNLVGYAPYLRNHTSYDCHLCKLLQLNPGVRGAFHQPAFMSIYLTVSHMFYLPYLPIAWGVLVFYGLLWLG